MRQSDIKFAIKIIGSLIGQKDEDYEKALHSQSLDTEAPLKYELRDLSFIEHTRVATVTFVKIRTYRTVERYVQRDNQKYKIYSEWKKRESRIAPFTIKLTNNVLENLYSKEFLKENNVFKREDLVDLVAEHAFDIIAKLATMSDGFSLIPSWFEKEILEKELLQKKDIAFKKINNAKVKISNAEKEIQSLEQENRQIKNKIEMISQRRENKFLFFIFSILSVGIYAYLNSAHSFEKYSLKLTEHTKTSSFKIETLQSVIGSNIATIKQTQESLKKSRIGCAEKVKQLKPLSDEHIIESSGFVPLKDLAGVTYRKFKGVYIIRNRELDKIYVGQSKDVLKRITDHFTGTTPKNIIFAEDYYQSTYKSKEDLFEVKMEELMTKDELDDRERELILEYDSFNSGYNGTSGNT